MKFKLTKEEEALLWRKMSTAPHDATWVEVWSRPTLNSTTESQLDLCHP